MVWTGVSVTRSQTELSWQQSRCVKGIIPQADIARTWWTFMKLTVWCPPRPTLPTTPVKVIAYVRLDRRWDGQRDRG